MYTPSYGVYLATYKPVSKPHIISRYIPGYLQELQDGHAEELTLFKSQLEEVRRKMVNLGLSHLHRYKLLRPQLGGGRSDA
jgi:hypothetical protein